MTFRVVLYTNKGPSCQPHVFSSVSYIFSISLAALPKSISCQGHSLLQLSPAPTLRDRPPGAGGRGTSAQPLLLVMSPCASDMTSQGLSFFTCGLGTRALSALAGRVCELLGSLGQMRAHQQMWVLGTGAGRKTGWPGSAPRAACSRLTSSWRKSSSFLQATIPGSEVLVPVLSASLPPHWLSVSAYKPLQLLRGGCLALAPAWVPMAPVTHLWISGGD